MSASPTLTYIASYGTKRKGALSGNIKTCDVDTFVRRLTGGPTAVDRSHADAHTLRSPHLCEIFLGNPHVKPYYDWDKNVTSPEEVSAGLLHEQDALEGFIDRLHPDAEVVYANRSGFNPEKRVWKISLRAFVQGISMKVSDIEAHIRDTLGDERPEQLDTSVYKKSEQLLGCVGCSKTPIDTRVLKPLDNDVSFASYICQDLRGCKEFVPAVIRPSVPQRNLVDGHPQAALAVPVAVPVIPSELLPWLKSAFGVDESLIRLEERETLPSGAIKIPTRSKACPFKQTVHRSNHTYVQIKINRAIELCCYDNDCKGRANTVWWNSIPDPIKRGIARLNSTAGIEHEGQPLDMLDSSDSSVENRIVTEAQRMLSSSINRALRLGKDYTWVPSENNENQPRGTVYYQREERGCVACLNGMDEHSHSHQCRLMFSSQKQRRNVAIDCLHRESPINITDRHPGLYAVHDTYRAEVRISGDLNVKVQKVDKDFELCWNTLVERAIEEEILRSRNDEYVFKLMPDKPCCYVRYLSFTDFVHETLGGMAAYTKPPRMHKSIMEQIKDNGDKNFPFLEKRVNLSWVGTANGLIYLGNPDRTARESPRFVPFEEVTDAMSNSIVVRQYIDQEVHVSCPEDYIPNWNKMISYQIPEPEIQAYFKAFLGRLMYPVGSDGHQVALMILGVARTGKSTVIETIKDIVGLGNIASFSGEGEKVFGIGGSKLDKSLIMIDDLPSDTQKMLSGTEFQAMVSGGIVDAKSKNKDARTVGWKIPFCIATNVWPNWPDNDGSIVRRIVTFFMERPLENADTGIAYQIKENELATLLWIFVNAYFDMLVNNPIFARKQFYDACPAYFQKGRLRHINKLDKVNGFFTATPDELRVITRGTEDEPEEWIQYTVEIRVPQPARKAYGTAWTLVQEAFEVYRGKRFNDKLTMDHPAWRRNKLKVVDKGHVWSFQDDTRKNIRHVVGLYVKKEFMMK